MRAGTNWTGKGISISNYKATLVESRMNGRAGMVYANLAGGTNVSWWMNQYKHMYLCVGCYILRFK